MRPLLAIILCVWEIWSGSNNRVYIYHVFRWLAKKKDYQKKKSKKKARHRTNFEADLWPKTGDVFLFFFGGGGCISWILMTLSSFDMSNLNDCELWISFIATLPSLQTFHRTDQPVSDDVDSFETSSRSNLYDCLASSAIGSILKHTVPYRKQNDTVSPELCFEPSHCSGQN